jgi:class 3 adenylate cyclase
MPSWNLEYYKSLQEKFNSITDGLDTRIEKVIDGRTAPALDDITIGSGRKMRAATLFFDIREFSNRNGSADLHSLKKTLVMLDCVIPMVMQIVYDNGGYVEKNTGDGIMALLGVEADDKTAANNALNTATTIFYVLKNIVNPFLTTQKIDPVNARIGIDLGTILIARVGLPSGTSKHQRNFLTAVGPSANLASKIQQEGGTNEIWTGDLIYQNAEEYRKKYFKVKTPANWTWTYAGDENKKYNIWEYDAVRTEPK